MDIASVEGLRALTKLVSDADDVTTVKGVEEEQDYRRPNFTPASIGATSVSSQEHKCLEKSKIKNRKSKLIWNLHEVPSAAEAAQETLAINDNDGRIEPSYEFLYKQAVTANDAYFGMGEKDPSSTQCEDIVVRIDLPGLENFQEVSLDVQSTYVKLESKM